MKLPAALASTLAPLVGRPLLENYVRDSGLTTAIEWAPSSPSAELQLQFWSWLEDLEATQSGSIFGTPRLTRAQAATLAEFSPQLLTPLADSSPVPGLTGTSAADQGGQRRQRVDRVGSEARMRAWVGRTLCPGRLNFCPFTGSAALAGVGLSQSGVTPAPILYAVSDASGSTALLADFWRHTTTMVNEGETAYSSIVLACPLWDTSFDAWRDDIFPTLEASVLSAGLGRTLGVVCFHPEYATPPPSFLARQRFGHMYGVPTLRKYLEMHEPELAAATTDDELAWAANYQRRAPHAMINVLWSRQLEAAESKRTSSLLYATNIARCLAQGRLTLEDDAQRERGG